MIEDYIKAKKTGDKLLRKSKTLAVLDTILPNSEVLTHQNVGIVEIPLSMVVGTVTANRASSFAEDFLPVMKKDSEFAYKWSRLYDSQIEEGIREPIKCYEYMHRFYVLEGNKRVSVAKYLGVPSLEANVIRILPTDITSDNVKTYFEFLEFYKVAGFYDIEFTKPGSYELFAEEIGVSLKEKWSHDTITTVRGAYFRFLSVYEEQGGKNVSLTPGDAFLIYCNVFRFASLLDYKRTILSKRVQMIWNEFLFEEEPDKNSILLKEGEMSITPGLSKYLHRAIYSEDSPLKIAFLYRNSVETSLWASDHEIGRVYLENCFEGVVKTFAYNHCDDEESILMAVRNAMKEGCDIIFSTSAEQMRDILRISFEYPSVQFLNCSVNIPHASLRNYYGRLYEVKFLLGMVAAMHCDNHKIGYLADAPLYGTVSAINAFAYGASMIDPEVKIYLDWSDKKENHFLETCAQEKIAIYSLSDCVNVKEDNVYYGVVKKAGDLYSSLASPIWNWGIFYEKMVRSYLSGTWSNAKVFEKGKAHSYWWGMKEGVLDLHLSTTISAPSQKMLEIMRSGIMNHTVFPLPEITEDSDIATLTTLNDNVIGALPTYEEIKEDVRTICDISGVVKKNGSIQ